MPHPPCHRPLSARPAAAPPRGAFALVALALALSGCAGTLVPAGTPAASPAPLRAARHPALPPARALALPGLEGVIGASDADLVRQFGPPRLDESEGDSRKLQFAGTPCVLDVFLYPPAPGAPPRATYVEARRATDAREVDRASCIAMLRHELGAAPAPR